MKKSLLLMVSLLLTFSIYAQHEVSLSAGGGFSTWSLKKISTDIYSKVLPSYSTSFSYSYQFDRKFHIGSQLNFSQKGRYVSVPSSEIYTFEYGGGGLGDDPVAKHYKYKSKINYASFGLHSGYSIVSSKKLSINPTLGFYLGYLYRGKNKETYAFIEEGYEFLSTAEVINFENFAISRWEVGMSISMSLKYSVSPKLFMIFTSQYQQSLTKTFINYRNSSLFFELGFGYIFKNKSE